MEGREEHRGEECLVEAPREAGRRAVEHLVVRFQVEELLARQVEQLPAEALREAERLQAEHQESLGAVGVTVVLPRVTRMRHVTTNITAERRLHPSRHVWRSAMGGRRRIQGDCIAVPADAFRIPAPLSPARSRLQYVCIKA